MSMIAKAIKGNVKPAAVIRGSSDGDELQRTMPTVRPEDLSDEALV